ncbi:MAG: class I SAM-dependent methyltransferase [Acidimicrobiia bacterium]
MSWPETPASPAHAYQAYYGPAIFEPLAEQVVAANPPPPGARVLDVASGTGILSRRLAAAVGSGGRVLGVDVNPTMVQVARDVTGDIPTIEYRQGDGTALDLPDGAFDAVYCQQGLQFFPDRAAGARQMRRVLTGSGRAVVACWRGLDHHPLFAALADAEEPHLGALGVEVTRAELEAPFSLGDPAELEALLCGAGFREVSISPVSIDARFADADRFVHHMEYAYAAVIPQFAAQPEAFARYLHAIEHDTRQVVESHRQGDHVVVPMHAHVAVAR